jgi:tRNA 2-thiouridine synthesizing protein A
MEVLDLRGLKCPLPALLTRRALSRAGAGQELAVVSDDPLAAVDVPHMCHEEGHDVLAVERVDSAIRLLLRRGETAAPSGR